MRVRYVNTGPAGRDWSVLILERDELGNVSLKVAEPDNGYSPRCVILTEEQVRDLVQRLSEPAGPEPERDIIVEEVE